MMNKIPNIGKHTAEAIAAMQTKATGKGRNKVPDHVVREVVNELRRVAVEFHGTQQLRARLRRCIDPLL